MRNLMERYAELPKFLRPYSDVRSSFDKVNVQNKQKRQQKRED